MVIYFFPLTFLTLIFLASNISKNKIFFSKKITYYSVCIFFIFFIGFRYEIGCDWEQYKGMFDKYNSMTFVEILKNNISSKQKLQEIGHIFLTSISQNIYILNFIYSIIFSLPLFYFCFQLKRTYFSLLISYPYYIIVVGMGPMRQAASVSLLMFSILLVKNKKYYRHFFISIISSLIHQSSIFFNGIILGSSLSKIKEIKASKKNIFIAILISLIFLYCLPSIINKVTYYITFYKYTDKYGARLVAPAKGSIYIWFINFVPSIIYLKNISKFKFNNLLNKILISFAITEFLLLPLVFLNSVIAYRLLLYLFPSSILITSYIPDLELLKIKKTHYLNFIIGISLLSLIIWIKFAFHSSCWVPYKNILLMQ